MPGIMKDLGPCSVTFNSIDLGDTMGGVIFRDTVESRDVKTDQDGVTPVDGVYVGRQVSVEVPLTRATLAKLADVIPGASTNTAGTILTVNNAVGSDRYATAAALVLSPLVNDVAFTELLTVFKASPSVDIEVVFDVDTQRVYKVIFTAYPDPASSNQMYKFGA